MDENVVAAITQVLLEAIKILGPAIIAAYAGYKAGRAQLDLRLRELALTNELQARTTVFEYYRDKVKRLQEQHAQLSNSLGQILGLTSGMKEDSEEVLAFAQLFQHIAASLPADIRMTKREIEQLGLTDNDWYTGLDDDLRSLETLIDDANPTALQMNGFTVVAVQDHLFKSNGLILEKQAARLFEPYVKPLNAEPTKVKAPR